MEDADIDTASLRSQLSEALGATVVDITVLHDGLNLSLSISTATENEAYVFRRPNRFRETDGFIDVQQEYCVLDRLQETPVPAPRPVLLGAETSVLADPFLIMTYVDGESVPLGSRLPERFRDPDARQRFGEVVIDTLADLHAVDVQPFTDVCRRRPPEDQLEEAIGRMEAATATTGHEPPGVQRVVDWLRTNLPADSETTLCHGDFRPANILFSGDTLPTVSGVLDWETAFLGDQLSELGYLLLRWRDRGDPTLPVEEIATRHPDTDVSETLSGNDAPGFAPFAVRPGSPTRQELVARYEGRTGRAFEHERFYRTLAAFVLAAVWEDIYRQQVESGSAADWEPRIEYMLLVADSIASGEYPL